MNARLTRLIAVTMTLTVLEVGLAGLVIRKPWMFSLIAWQMAFTYLIYWWRTRERLLGYLLLVPLTANVVQLVVDWYHVVQAETLVYNYALFRIWETPDYILAGWLFAFVQLGYLTLWLKQRIGMWPSVLLLSVGGSVVHTWYEEMAYWANAWRYVNASLLGHVSHWVIITFLFMLATLCYIVALLEKRPARDWALGGVVVGVGILGYSVLAVALFRYL